MDHQSILLAIAPVRGVGDERISVEDILVGTSRATILTNSSPFAEAAAFRDHVKHGGVHK